VFLVPLPNPKFATAFAVSMMQTSGSRHQVDARLSRCISRDLIRALTEILGEARARPGAVLESRAFHHYVDCSSSSRIQPMDDKTRIELEAAAFRRLLEHLRKRTDVQNIDLMNLAGFCRNCLSNWMKDAADAQGVSMSKEQSREAIYGMPYEDWKAKYQKDAPADQQAKFAGEHKH
jgi:uncharacterized protein